METISVFGHPFLVEMAAGMAAHEMTLTFCILSHKKVPHFFIKDYRNTNRQVPAELFTTLPTK